MGAGTSSGKANGTTQADLTDRWSKAIAKIGGTQALLDLPPQVSSVLMGTNSLEYKVKMLELIANNPQAVKQLKKKG